MKSFPEQAVIPAEEIARQAAYDAGYQDGRETGLVDGSQIAALPLLTAKETAAWLKISYLAFIDWHNTPGKTPRHVHVADRIRYRPADLDAWVSGDATASDDCTLCPVIEAAMEPSS